MLFKLSLLLAVVYFAHGGQAQHAAVVMVAAVMLFVQARLEPFSSKQKNVLQYLGTGLTFLMAFGGVMLSYMRLAQAEASQRLFGKELNDTMVKYEGNMDVIRGILDVVLYAFTIPAIVAFWAKMCQKGMKKIAKRKAKKKAKKMAKLRGENGEDAELELTTTTNLDHPNPIYRHPGPRSHDDAKEGSPSPNNDTWVRGNDPNSGHPYWYNQATGTSSWKAPPGWTDDSPATTTKTTETTRPISSIYSPTTETPSAAGDARMSL